MKRNAKQICFGPFLQFTVELWLLIAQLCVTPFSGAAKVDRVWTCACLCSARAGGQGERADAEPVRLPRAEQQRGSEKPLQPCGGPAEPHHRGRGQVPHGVPPQKGASTAAALRWDYLCSILSFVGFSQSFWAPITAQCTQKGSDKVLSIVLGTTYYEFLMWERKFWYDLCRRDEHGEVWV